MEFKGHFVQVYDECLEQLHLSISEAYVLCHIYGWCKNNEGKVFEKKQDELAAQYGISKRKLQTILTTLTERGYIFKVRNNTGMGYCITDATKAQNLPHESAKFAFPKRKICASDAQNLPHESANFATPTLFNYTINYILRDYAPARVRDFGEVIETGLKSLYQKNGGQYIPCEETTAEFTPALIGKLQEVYGADADLTVVWPAWLAKVWPGADAWQRANFDLPVICSQFNKLNNNTQNLNDHGTHQTAEPEPQRTGTAATLASVASREELAALDGIFDQPTAPSRP